MAVHEFAGKKARDIDLVNIPRLISAYYLNTPNMENKAEHVSFGTSGHRGSSLNSSFTQAHILAISQAIADYRKAHNITGPLFIGMDTHALSEAALSTAIEVLGANDILVYIEKDRSYTPTPSISHAILKYNHNRTDNLADGIVITPSHNPPCDGGFKYNSTDGGPADTSITSWIENRANELLKNDLKEVKRIPFNRAMLLDNIKQKDMLTEYVEDLKEVIDLKVIKEARVKIGVDPLGGSGLFYWDKIAQMYDLDINVVNYKVDPTFSFMTLDKDGKIRMDCSSPYAMAGLISLKDKFDIAFGNDPDYDRHGIVCHSGLMNPNHYLSVAVSYLYTHRSLWSESAMVGKTVVTSSMLNRVAQSLNRKVLEVPVGFKYFVKGLYTGTLGFGCEESAGASFLKHQGGVWTTDKDGIIASLLSAEILARTQKDPAEHYKDLTQKFGEPLYNRLDAPASIEQKAILKNLDPSVIKADTLAGEKIIDKITKAPGNNEPFGGLKVITKNGWFAARPSGTENIYKIYAESFVDAAHLKALEQEAQIIVDEALGKK